jgi:hypothetical protein
MLGGKLTSGPSGGLRLVISLNLTLRAFEQGAPGRFLDFIHLGE